MGAAGRGDAPVGSGAAGLPTFSALPLAGMSLGWEPQQQASEGTV